jgi:hypothetical protein
MTHPAIRQGEQDLERIRGMVQDARTRFDTDSGDVVAKLETFRQGLVAAIGEISPAEAFNALELEAKLLFNQKRPAPTHAENVRALMDSGARREEPRS